MEKWKRVEKNWRWPTTPETPAQFLYLKTKIPQRDARIPVTLSCFSRGKGPNTDYRPRGEMASRLTTNQEIAGSRPAAVKFFNNTFKAYFSSLSHTTSVCVGLANVEVTHHKFVSLFIALFRTSLLFLPFPFHW